MGKSRMNRYQRSPLLMALAGGIGDYFGSTGVTPNPDVPTMSEAEAAGMRKDGFTLPDNLHTYENTPAFTGSNIFAKGKASDLSNQVSLNRILGQQNNQLNVQQAYQMIEPHMQEAMKNAGIEVDKQKQISAYLNSPEVANQEANRKLILGKAENENEGEKQRQNKQIELEADIKRDTTYGTNKDLLQAKNAPTLDLNSKLDLARYFGNKGLTLDQGNNPDLQKSIQDLALQEARSGAISAKNKNIKEGTNIEMSKIRQLGKDVTEYNPLTGEVLFKPPSIDMNTGKQIQGGPVRKPGGNTVTTLIDDKTGKHYKLNPETGATEEISSPIVQSIQQNITPTSVNPSPIAAKPASSTITDNIFKDAFKGGFLNPKFSIGDTGNIQSAIEVKKPYKNPSSQINAPVSAKGYDKYVSPYEDKNPDNESVNNSSQYFDANGQLKPEFEFDPITHTIRRKQLANP